MTEGVTGIKDRSAGALLVGLLDGGVAGIRERSAGALVVGLVGGGVAGMRERSAGALGVGAEVVAGWMNVDSCDMSWLTPSSVRRAVVRIGSAGKKLVVENGMVATMSAESVDGNSTVASVTMSVNEDEKGTVASVTISVDEDGIGTVASVTIMVCSEKGNEILPASTERDTVAEVEIFG